jgi:hypothetical protein
MNHIAPGPRPDLDDAYWSKFNAWQFLQASVPKAREKPDWKAINTHPIARRLAHRGKLIAIRPKTSTRFLVLDLDTLSRYHFQQNPHAIPQLQQALEDRLGLATCIPLRSSDSRGIHLWYWFKDEQNAYRLAEAVEIVLREAGFVLQAGHLETFPNRKAWIDSDNPDDWSQYHAIRLPLLEPGSYLLDAHNDYDPLLHPLLDQRPEFLRLIDHCQQRNDLTSERIEAILATQPKPFKKVSVTGNQYLTDLLDKVRDGWDGHGQTNQLLFDVTRLIRIFGHLLHGTEPYWETERLTVAIHDHLLTLPGREQFCGHNHELEKLAQDWAKWVQTTKYKPYGYGKTPLETELSPETTLPTPTPTHNQKLQQTARERIINALVRLLNQDRLPPTTTARIAALESLGIQRGTLYRHRDLWHPENLLDRPEPASSGEFTPVIETDPTPTRLQPRQAGEFTPIAHKELEARSAAPPEHAPELKELGGSGGISTASAPPLPRKAPNEKKRSSQAEQMQRWLVSGDPILEAEARSRLAASAINSEMPTTEFTPGRTPERLSECDQEQEQEENSLERSDTLDLSDVLARIDCERVRLQWQPEEFQQYCLNQYGQIRAHLTDDELISLLLALRQLEIGLK